MKSSRFSFKAAYVILVAALALSLGFPMLALARVAAVTRVSEDSTGTLGNAASNSARLSADGRYVTFRSVATNLVAGDTNAAQDIFVHDRSSGQTTRVSVTSNGDEGNGFSGTPDISGDGRFVTFSSLASNLVLGDTNAAQDIFVHDRSSGQTTRVSVASNGDEANGSAFEPAISADGRYVAFTSSASNLVANDTNGFQDVFVHDRSIGVTTRVSVSTGGSDANNESFTAAISADGRYVAFASIATNLTSQTDTNGSIDVFVYDQNTGTTRLASVGVSGFVAGNGLSLDPDISGDGRYVVFSSAASDLVVNDINGEYDIFVYDLTTGGNSLVSQASGAQTNNDSYQPDISGDGRYVVFASDATNLVTGDTNAERDIFVRDLSTGQVVRASVSISGVEGESSAEYPAISAEGTFVAFESFSTNLVAEPDTNSNFDIFVTRLNLEPDTIGVFRPSVATFFLRNTNTGGLADFIQPFGSSTDIPVVGDWNGDGLSTIGVYRTANKQFYLNDHNTDGTPDATIYFFAPRGVPIIGDWDGNGTDTVGIYSDGTFMLSNSTSSGLPDTYVEFGDAALDRPLAGDWNGDGRDTVGVWRASATTFYLSNLAGSGFGAADLVILYGAAQDVGFVGDWDADGVDSIGVYRPSNGDVYLRNSLSDGLPDILFNYGIAQDIPLAGVWSFPVADQTNDASNSAPIFVPKR